MADHAQTTVLVVEDNIAMNTVICNTLELHSYRILSAKDGEDAISILTDQRPDIIVSDIVMPRLDGYALLRHARSDDRLRTVPFIFLTAHSTAQDLRLAKTIGIEDYLVKPADPEDLILAVENAVRRAEAASAEFQSQMDKRHKQIVEMLQHEFRTPLTLILSYADYLSELMDESFDVTLLRDSVVAIMEGGRRLHNLIEKFLTLADLQNRTSLPDLALHSAGSILEHVVANVRQQADSLSLQVVLKEQNAEQVILADERHLFEALRCIVENALLYRRPESQQIQLSIELAGGRVGLHVVDEGCGIPNKMLERLRCPFVQVDRNNRTIPGAGLSLALVQHIVALHGGQLEIESEVGVGSTFTIWLPEPPADELVSLS